MPISQTASRELVSALLDAAANLEARLTNSLSNIKGISYGEYRLLSSLAEQPAGTASRVDLARVVGLTPSGVTRALKPLERLGFVETMRNDRDARQALASLTEQGQALVVDAIAVANDTIATLMDHTPVTPAEGEIVTRFCRDLSWK
ncbi:MAG: MarR family transcriptional regulator [Acidimicrobiales bacterium]